MAIFGKDNSDLLHQILREIGELRERVTGQQQAVDQIRHDTTVAINSGLSENRAVVRDGLARHHDTIGEPLARISTELVTIRASINDLTRSYQPPTSQTAAEPPDEPDATVDQQPDQDAPKLLKAAAGISAASLQMHRDTWAFLIEHTAGDRHFHVPGKVDDRDGAVIVHVSGPSIVAALTSLDRVSRTDDDPGTRAIAGHLHQRLTDTVQAIVDNRHRGDGADPVVIVIDDRIGAARETPAGPDDDS